MKKFKMFAKKRKEKKKGEEISITAKDHGDAICFLMKEKFGILIEKGNPFKMLQYIDEKFGIFIFSPITSDKSGKEFPPAMRVTLGEDGLERSHQQKFTKEVPCPKCGAKARIAFVADEMPRKGEQKKHRKFVFQLHPNDKDGNGYWWHDACSVAVYLCPECFEAVAKTTQA